MFRIAIAIVAVLAVGAPALAASRDAVTLAYTAPAGCPDRAAVEAAVRERTPDVVFAPSAPRSFAIAITARGDDFVGTLSTSGDPTSAQELSARRCDDLVGALALVTALAIDPTGGLIHSTPSLAPPAPRWSLDATTSAAVAFGITPDPMPELAIEGRAMPRPWLALALGAVAGYDRAELDTGAARFVWTAIRPAACWRPVHGRFEASACGHVELGLTRATGEDIVLGQSVTRAWTAGGAHGDARWQVTPSVFVQLQAGASVPFQRDRYLFQPSMTIHETAAVTAWVGAGVGMRFR